MVFSLSLHVGKLISVSPLPGLRRTPNAALLSLYLHLYLYLELHPGPGPTHMLGSVWRAETFPHTVGDLCPLGVPISGIFHRNTATSQPAQRVKHRTILIYLVYSSPSSCIHSYPPPLSRNGKEPMEMIRHIQSAVSVSWVIIYCRAASRRRQTALQQ